MAAAIIAASRPDSAYDCPASGHRMSSPRDTTPRSDICGQRAGSWLGKKDEEAGPRARHANLRIVLEATDAGAVPAARVDDHVRAALGVHRDALWRNDAQQRVVDRTLERAPVHHDLVVEAQHRRQSLALVLDEVVAALAQRVPEQDGALREVDTVSRAACPELQQRRRICRHPGDLLLCLLGALFEAREREARAGLRPARPSRHSCSGSFLPNCSGPFFIATLELR